MLHAILGADLRTVKDLVTSHAVDPRGTSHEPIRFLNYTFYSNIYLVAAAKFRRPEIARYLIEAGASPTQYDVPPGAEWTPLLPLHWAWALASG
jgi:hypothetical protein